MNRPVFLQRLLLSSIFLCFIAFPVQSQNEITWVDEQVLQDVDYGLNNGFSTSVTTYNDNIYYTYVGADQTMYVGKKTASDNTVMAVWTNLQSDRNHTKPSIAVDKNGYVHVTGDMHNQEWRYYISSNPEDINSWTKKDLPGGQKVTYPEFYKDRNDELYLMYRIRNVVGTRERRDHVGAMIRYNADSQSFQVLGGTNYDSDEPLKAMVWGLGHGGQGCWYQQPRPRIYFDEKNRMHLTASVIDGCLDELDGDGDYNNQSHVIYAYSDDGGETFNKIDGTAIGSLPLSKDNASVVVERSSQQDIVPAQQIGAFNTNSPVVSYGLNDGSHFSRRWNGSKWVDINVPDNTATFMTHKSGVLAWYYKFETGNARFQITADGKNWVALEAPSNGNPNRFSEAMDAAYFDQTGDFRISTVGFYGPTPKTTIHTFKTGSTVQGLVTENRIRSLKVPATVTPGSTQTVKLKYTASENRDIILQFQLDHDPWTIYGKVTTTVLEGTRSMDIDIPINLNTPVAQDDYKFMAYITPVGGDFLQKLDSRQIANIDCIPANSLTISEDVWVENSSELMKTIVFNTPTLTRLFPNPLTKQELNLVFDGQNQSPRQIKIVDLQGKTVLNRKVLAYQSSLRLDMGHVSNGIFIMIVEMDDGVLNQYKIMVDR